MTALINTGSVKAFLETASKLAAAERALSTPVNNLQIAYDIELGTASINATLPFIADINPGGMVITPTDYAPIADFDAAGVADLGPSAVGMSNATLALCLLAQVVNNTEEAQRAQGKVFQDGTGVTMTVNYDTLIVTINAVLPITQSLINGVPTVEAVDYLA